MASPRHDRIALALLLGGLWFCAWGLWGGYRRYSLFAHGQVHRAQVESLRPQARWSRRAPQLRVRLVEEETPQVHLLLPARGNEAPGQLLRVYCEPDRSTCLQDPPPGGRYGWPLLLSCLGAMALYLSHLGRLAHQRAKAQASSVLEGAAPSAQRATAKA